MPLIPYESLINGSPNWLLAYTSGILFNIGGPSVISPTNPDYLLPANTLTRGNTFRVNCTGWYTTVGTGTMALGVYLNGTTTALGITPTTNCVSNATQQLWWLEWIFTVVQLGPSGLINAQGKVTGIGGANSVVLGNQTVFTQWPVNTTVGNTVGVVTNFQSGVNNQIQVLMYMIEQVY
jgi:hypothetical protein